MELAENCPNLRYLCISNCGHVTDQSLVALATYCQGLVTLECAAVSQLTDAGFQVLYTNKKNISISFSRKNLSHHKLSNIRPSLARVTIWSGWTWKNASSSPTPQFPSWRLTVPASSLYPYLIVNSSQMRPLGKEEKSLKNNIL